MTTHRCSRQKPSRPFQGFTLIELLVVVAIIALLISILLPSLSRARAQARTTVCASRLAQITKAMLMYSEDYAEAPPFILRGDGGDPNWHDDPGNSDNWGKETWLAASSTMEWIYVRPEEEWLDNGDPEVLKSGTLYTYTRFDEIYKCPDYDRIGRPEKDQNAFNFTRNLLGQKAELGPNPLEDIAIYTGALKLSSPYNSARLPMMFDEAWDCYVGWAEGYGWVWGGHDPVLDLWNSCVGQYHGAGKLGWVWKPERGAPPHVNDVEPNVPAKSGSVGYYDGHVGLDRDPIPNLDHYGGRPPTMLGFGGVLGFPYDEAYAYWIEDMIYAQQGKTLDQWAGM